ncbi:hypothetical protein PCASD_12932 [Puccinia coronata f. sp. avenae]|uniref:Glycosyltransferase family 32 protein n=1 Tax=Puccinia coronata f. sp. avenae TaxID=200324 RepID=A0A2N5U9Z2_9BASI|nr:hypothetical protein PCASD_12932 [Puccinia coronata f. sp. avenae]
MNNRNTTYSSETGTDQTNNGNIGTDTDNGSDTLIVISQPTQQHRVQQPLPVLPLHEVHPHLPAKPHLLLPSAATSQSDHYSPPEDQEEYQHQQQQQQRGQLEPFPPLDPAHSASGQPLSHYHSQAVWLEIPNPTERLCLSAQLGRQHSTPQESNIIPSHSDSSPSHLLLPPFHPDTPLLPLSSDHHTNNNNHHNHNHNIISTHINHDYTSTTTNDSSSSSFNSPPQYSAPASAPPSYLNPALFSPSIRRRSPTVHLNPSFCTLTPSPMDCPSYSPPSSTSYEYRPPACQQSPASEKPPNSPQSSATRSSFLFRLSSKPQHATHSLAPATRHPRRRSWVDYLLALLVLVIIGTVVVLSTVNFYMGIYPSDLILPSELEAEPLRPSRVPKIIHQTWKTDQIPERWVPVRESCVAAHESWEYMLWTDQSGRELIEREYPWFLPVYDGYRYPIQRADAVRYFILHHYGGVYMDLDIGCLRPMDSLLRFDLVLPQTVPVGISNDLMFSAKEHPFMDFIIHRLAQFDHDYRLNYATVMFSTGPMALSALLNMFRRSPSFALTPGMPAFGPVRILPPKLYGKNLAAPQPSPGPYFTHYYGSSWHTDGAGPVLWLGKFGMFWLYAGIVIVLFYAARAVFRHWRSDSSSGEPEPASTWSTATSPVKSRGSAGTLWKRRLLKVRRTEGRLADVLLLPGHWLDKATTQPSSRSLRAHQKDCIQCKSCTLAHGMVDSCHQLPLYDSRSLQCLAPGKRSPRKSHRTDNSPVEEEWEEVDEDTALLSSSTSTSDLISNPTPTLLPPTPNFYRNPNLPAPGFPSLRVEMNQEVAPGLPSPLLNAIYRLAEMAGIVSENGQRSDLSSIFPARNDDTSFPSGARPNPVRKVD